MCFEDHLFDTEINSLTKKKNKLAVGSTVCVNNRIYCVFIETYKPIKVYVLVIGFSR